jgi:hypothetical protein
MLQWPTRSLGLVAALILALCPVLSIAASGPLSLEVRDTRLHSRLVCAPVRVGDEFSLRYTHSTAKTEVEEQFEIRGPGDIVLRRMLYASAGAGVPDVAPPGTTFRVVDGRFVLDGIDRRFAALERIRVAYFYPFILRIGERQHALSDLARGRLVDVRVAATAECGDYRSEHDE